MAQTIDTVVDWARFAQAREQLAGNFWRVMGYLRDDGHKAVSEIEAGVRRGDAVSLIGPAELLKTEAVHMGALGVAEIAEQIEMQARDCVEWHQSPELLVEDAVTLRSVFEETVALFEREASPLLARRPDLRRNIELTVS
jgi:histidine phosphotransfer protein HptB